MLRKRNRSVHQDQNKACPYMTVSDFLMRNDFRNQRSRKNSVFNVPGLFVGLSMKGLFECDAAKSPTSPLDYRVLSSVGGRFKDQKCWNSTKVGLSIFDDSGGKAESDTKNIIFGPQLKMSSLTCGNDFDTRKPSKSLPRNYLVFSRSKGKPPVNKASSSRCIFEIGDEADDPTEPELVEVFRSCSLDSSARCFPPMPSIVRKSNLGSSSSERKFCFGNVATNHFHYVPFGGPKTGDDALQYCNDTALDMFEFISAADIELSENYTCVTTHGPNPKTTHIYSDCILGCRSKLLGTSASGLATNEGQCNSMHHPSAKCNDIPAPLRSKDFLSVCYNCSKKLDGGDIFMYRGEKAFCSLECRESEIVNNEDSDETGNNLSENSPENLAKPR